MALSKGEKLALVAEADKSLLHWAKVFSPGAFYRPFSAYAHGQAVRFLEAPVDLSVDIVQRCRHLAAFRGLGKSSLFLTMNLVRRVCMQRFHYGTLGSNTYDQAEEHLATVKWQFDNNPKLNEAFGDMRGDVWRSDELRFSNGIKLKAVGASGQARGRRNVDMSRPDFAIGDDLESIETAASAETTAKIMRWWLADVIGSLNPDTGYAQLLGTIISERSVLAQLVRAHPERSLVLELFDDAYKSRWPEVYSDEWIEQKRLTALKEGKLNELWSEYRNKPIAAENAKWKPEYFTYWSEETLPRSEMLKVLIADPGHTSKTTSDGSAIMVVGITLNGDIYVLDYVNIRATNSDFYEEIAKLCIEHEIWEVYIDDIGAKEYITVPLQNYLANAGLYVIVKPAPGKGSKDDRLGGLLPLYKAWKVKHSPHKHHELESQLLAFNKSEFDDLHDVLAYVPFIAKERGLGLLPEPTPVERAEQAARAVIRQRVV